MGGVELKRVNRDNSFMKFGCERNGKGLQVGARYGVKGRGF